jgi:hypothetical protein
VRPPELLYERPGLSAFGVPSALAEPRAGEAAARMEGFTSFATASVLEAVKLYEQIRPTLVISDEYLAGSTTGSDLLRVLRHK